MFIYLYLLDLLATQKRKGEGHHPPVAQLVEHWAATREVMSLTLAGPTLRVLK